MKFITFDGCDKSGKSTLISDIIGLLPNVNIKIYCEKDMYNIDGKFYTLSEKEKLVRVLESRKMLRSELQDDINSGKYDLILADRYMISTLIYQQTELQTIAKYWFDFISPDVQFILQPPFEYLDSKYNDDFSIFQREIYNRIERFIDGNESVIVLHEPKTYFLDFIRLMSVVNSIFKKN